MRRELTAFFALLLLCGGIAFQALRLSSFLEELRGQILASQEAAEAGDWEAAQQLAQKSAQAWDEKTGWLETFVCHEETEALTDCFCALSDALTASSAVPEGSYRALLLRLSDLAEMQGLSLSGIF